MRSHEFIYYAHNKLKYYGQTGIEFKRKVLISLIIGGVTVRQSLINSNYQMTVALKVPFYSLRCLKRKWEVR